jgi:hypothetical protein
VRVFQVDRAFDGGRGSGRTCSGSPRAPTAAAWPRRAGPRVRRRFLRPGAAPAGRSRAASKRNGFRPSPSWFSVAQSEWPRSTGRHERPAARTYRGGLGFIEFSVDLDARGGGGGADDCRETLAGMALDIREQFPLAPLSTLGVGGPARYYARVTSEGRRARSRRVGARARPAAVRPGRREQRRALRRGASRARAAPRHTRDRDAHHGRRGGGPRGSGRAPGTTSSPPPSPGSGRVWNASPASPDSSAPRRSRTSEPTGRRSRRRSPPSTCSISTRDESSTSSTRSAGSPIATAGSSPRTRAASSSCA